MSVQIDNKSDFPCQWRIVTGACMLGWVYLTVCVFSSSRVKFLTALGLEDLHFGWIASLGSLAFCFQILGGVLANRLVRRKSVWMSIVIAHRLLFLGVLITPVLFGAEGLSTAKLAWIIAVLFLHDGLMKMGEPMWYSWMADLVPQDTFNHEFSKRQRYGRSARIVTQVLVVIVFGAFEERGMVIAGYTLIGVVAVIAGIADIWLFKFIPEPPVHRNHKTHVLKTLVEPLTDCQFRPYLIYKSIIHLTMTMFYTFMPVYLIKHLGINAWVIDAMVLGSVVMCVLTSTAWGRLCDKYGTRPVMQITAFFKTTLMICVLFVTTDVKVYVPLLVFGCLVDGIMSGGMLLAGNSYLMLHTPRKNRPMYIAASNVVSMGIFGALSPLAAGYIIDSMEGYTFSLGFFALGGYHIVFMLSIALRLTSVVIAGRMSEEKAQPTKVMLSDILMRLCRGFG